MITVTKKTQDLTEGIMALCEGAKQDYYRYATRGVPGDITGYQKEQYDSWDDKTQIKNGKKYIKVIQEHRVFAFIVKEAGGIISDYPSGVFNLSSGRILACSPSIEKEFKKELDNVSPFNKNLYT